MTGSAAARWRTYAGLPAGLKALVVLSTVVGLGSYMITPFIGVLLVKGVGLDTGTAGLLVAVATFVQFGGSIVGGPVADRLGLRPTMIVALLLRTLGLVLLALAVRVHFLVLPAVVLVAAGPALYLPANKAYIVRSVSDELRPLFLAISAAALNVGMGLGPFLAVLLIGRDPVVLLLVLAGFFALITVAHQVAMQPVAARPEAPGGGTEAGGTEAGGGSTLRGALSDALRPVLFNVAAFYLYFSFQSFIGLYAAAESHLGLVGWVMLLNCAMMAVLQPLLAGRIARAGYRMLLAGSFLLMAAGTAVMCLGGTFALLLGTAVFTVGEAFVFLRGDLEVVGRIPDRPAFAFGVQRLTTGVGGLFAGAAGGFLFGHFQHDGHPGRYWLAVAAQCAVVAVLGLVLGGSSAGRTERAGTEDTAGREKEPAA
ncbi:MFS transporter [Streptomyces morookaense]|uniref:MFS transporter n=1 Tax=Streptomyces morookaense TaxID=1970 RepID=A0A7Y7E5A8_STRMO|nr:MFS transporter [Streptomyces morookaense]NVK76683.1 MFS transporter [Streptomyces morookaense]GHF27253.1 MFS transporter [Streptomyces morookaense]